MTSVLLGGFAQRASFTTGYMHSTGNLADCRAAYDGSKPMVIDELYGAVSGNGASRSLQMYLGGAGVSFSVGSAGSAADTGWLGTNLWLTSAGAGVEYGYQSLSGSCWFARTANGTGFTQGAFGTWTGSIGMYYDFLQVASAPTITSVTPNTNGDQATVIFTAPADNGGATVTSYNVQRATNSAFTTGVATINVTSLTATFTGLTPGTAYYYRILPVNYVSAAASILGGAASPSVLSVQPDPGLGRIYSGSTFVQLDGHIRDLANANWVELDGMIRSLDNTAWVELGS